MEILKVISVGETQEDVNGMPYKVVEFETLGKKKVMTASGIVIVETPTRKSSRAFQGHTYLQLSPLAKKLGKVDKNGNPKYKDLTAEEIADVDSEFGFNLEVGKLVAGDIVTREVAPYDIPVGDPADGEVREVSTYSRVILGDTGNPAFQSQIVQEFRRQNHELIEKNEELILEGAPSKEEVEASV